MVDRRSHYFSCSQCGRRFSKEQYHQMEKTETPHLPESRIVDVSATCPDCGGKNRCTVNLESGDLLPYALHVDGNCTKEALKESFTTALHDLEAALEDSHPSEDSET